MVLLAGALKFQASVTFLNLDGNKISDAGAIAIAKALEVNASVLTIQNRK